MSDVVVNYAAVLVAAVVYWVIGALWYSPVLFAKPWQKLNGMPASSGAGMPKGMGKTLVKGFLAGLVMSYVLAVVVGAFSAATAGAGAMVGFWMWLGFVATMGANRFIYNGERLSWKLYLIDQGYLLIALVVMGGILAQWA